MHFQPGGAERLDFFVPMIKIDEEQRLVYLRAAREEPDRAREVMDYASAVPQFEAWSAEQLRNSGGLSKGNIRAMHRRDSASGVVREMKFHDLDKAVDLCIYVSDDQDWRKCLTGTYTGASIGGGYLRKWNDPNLPGHIRYTPRIEEISLVDRPCITSARIAELVKVDGTVTTLTLHGRARTFAEIWTPAPPTFAQLWKKAA
jgi:hypothetical protein